MRRILTCILECSQRLGTKYLAEHCTEPPAVAIVSAVDGYRVGVTSHWLEAPPIT